jgi:hypothetical protein
LLPPNTGQVEGRRGGEGGGGRQGGGRTRVAMLCASLATC